MTATVVLQRASRQNWLKHRREGLGGTDVGAVLGFNPWATQLDIWLSKTGRGDDTKESYPMRRGTYLEPFLLAEYARATGAIIERPPALLAHPAYPFIRASLDGLAHHRDRTVIVDSKAPTWRGRTDWWDESKLCPDYIAVQMLAYCAVTGLDEAVLVADVAGEFTTVTVMRDLAWEERALPLLAAWWDKHVVHDEPPPVDWERDTVPALNRTWVTEPGTSVEASDSVAGAVAAYAALYPRQKERERTLAALKVQIREGMSTAQTLTVGGVKVASLDSRGVLRVNHNAQKENGE